MSTGRCPNSTFYTVNNSVYVAARVFLLLPLSVFILCLGYQRWRRRRRRCAAAASHSDVLTYHMAAAELVWAGALVPYFCGLFSGLPLLVAAGSYLFFMNFLAQTFFHVLACAERYLAAVRPVAYLGLRGARGARLRDASVGCVYALCLAVSPVGLLKDPLVPVASLLVFIVASLAAISFFSLAVLRVLIRPGPGEAGGAGERADPSKQRAFLAILAVMAAVWLWFLGLLLPAVLHQLRVEAGVACALQNAGVWFSLPSSLVLHLLHLHRTRWLPCCPARA